MKDRTVLAGTTQEPEVIEKIHKDYSFVDLVFGTHNFHKFPELFYRSLNTEGQIIDVLGRNLTRS